MKALKWKDVYETSYMKYGYVSRQLNSKFAWWFIGFEDNEKFPRPVILKAKTLRGAKTEAMKCFRKYLYEIAKTLP